MDWTALFLSLRLAGWTVLILLPVAVVAGRHLAYRDFAGKGFVAALVMLPLVLPPTVFGFYLLVTFGARSPLGQAWQAVFGHQLVFTFQGLLVASVIFNLPFAIQPAQRGFEAIPLQVREAAACCGMAPWQSLWRVELPLAWPGLMTAMVLTFAHTLGEFGIVLMVGGSIPGVGVEPACAGHRHPRALGRPEARDGAQERGLARAGMADQRQELARLDPEGHVERNGRRRPRRHLERHQDSRRPTRAESQKVSVMVTSEIARRTWDITAAPAMSKPCTLS